MKDEKLLKMLNKDSSYGMERLIDKYAGLVYTIVKNKLSGTYCNSSDIEDCVADVFSEFYFEIQKIDLKKGSIKAFLCVIAHNNAIDFIRKQKINTSLVDKDTYFEIKDDIIIEDKLQDDEMRAEVLNAIKSLGEPDSSIIIRKYLLCQSSKEIASVLKLSVSNVDTRTHRALNKLRKKIGGESCE